MYSVLSKALISGLVLAWVHMPGPIGVSPAAAAEITAESNARNRVNYAGRQRMLTQQIARNACFVMAGVDPERFVGKTEANIRQFNTVIVGLREGDSNLGILPETDTDVITSLEQVERLWHVLGPAAQQISAGDLHSIPMQQLISLNMSTLAHMHDTVQIMAERYPDTRISGDLLATVALAGRQRMLTQKVSKELCFKAIGLKNLGARDVVEATVSEFDLAMTKLMEGAPEEGIIAPPSRQVKRQLVRAGKAWDDFKQLVDRIKDDPEIDHGTRVKLANISDQVLREMDLAVTMYTQ